MGGFSVGFMVLPDGIVTAFICLARFRLGDFFGLCRKSTALSTAVQTLQLELVVFDLVFLMIEDDVYHII